MTPPALGQPRVACWYKSFISGLLSRRKVAYSSPPSSGWAGRRILGPRWLLGALLWGVLAGCTAEMQTDPDGLEGCWCRLIDATTGASLVIGCGSQRCLGGQVYACVEGLVEVRGACSAHDAGAEGEGEGRDLGPADGGSPADLGDAAACPPGGGRCENNVFIPCAPGATRQPCRADLCVPTGEGPVAGCLAREGSSCVGKTCAPGLVCLASGVCGVPAGCEAEDCDTEGLRGCADPSRPAVCRRDPQTACLGWVATDPCPTGERCHDGECVRYCTLPTSGCPAGEACSDRYGGCISDGSAGFSPATGFCQKTADCLTPGAVCLDAGCAPPCLDVQDCLAQGAATACCVTVGTYGICRVTGMACP